MSEIDLTVLARGEAEAHAEENAKNLTPMGQANLALKECGFGWFHMRLLVASYFGFSAGILVSNTTPYILPNAECDLDMDLLRKGVLTSLPFIGMLFSSIIAGFLVDTFGRKRFLVGGYGLMAFFNVVSAMSQTYTVMLVSKFCEGFVFAAAFSPTITFVSEFCHNGIRDRVMLLQSSFQASIQIVLAALSWAILMQDWRVVFFDGAFVLNTWNFYILILSIFALMSCILYSLLPESPKYLIAQHRYQEAREILIYIYKTNKRKPADTCTFADIWKDKTTTPIDESPELTKASVAQRLTAGLHNVKPLFMKPHLRLLVQFCTMIWFVMLLFNVIRMWFPQLSTIVEHYATEDNQELCSMLDAYTHDQRLKNVNITTTEVCVPVKSGSETYTNSIILGCVCMFPYFLTGMLVNRVGKKYLLIASGTLCFSVLLGVRWSASKVMVVALFSTAMALGQVMMSLIQATATEFFPTSMRTLAVSFLMTAGRCGSLFGNVLFPILLDIGCVVPFYSLAGIVCCVIIMAIFQPSKRTS